MGAANGPDDPAAMRRRLAAALAERDDMEAGLLAALAERDSLQESLHAARSYVEALRAGAGSGSAGAGPGGPAGPDPRPRPPARDVVVWVGTWLAPRMERAPGTRYRWCVRWHEHPEAVLVLTAMHEEFARSVADPRIGMSGFIRNSLHALGERLLAPGGPFSGCSPEMHEEAAVLPVLWPYPGEAPPPGWPRG